MKNFVAYVLIFSLLNLAGCYYQEQVEKNNNNFEQNSTIYLTVKDTTYIFKSNYYKTINDTFYGFERYKNKEGYSLKTVKIPIDKIDKIEIDKMDVTNTCLLSSAVILVLAIIIFLSTFKLMDGPILGSGSF